MGLHSMVRAMLGTVFLEACVYLAKLQFREDWTHPVKGRVASPYTPHPHYFAMLAHCIFSVYNMGYLEQLWGNLNVRLDQMVAFEAVEVE